MKMKFRHAAALALVGWYHRCSVGILPIHETPRPDVNAQCKAAKLLARVPEAIEQRTEGVLRMHGHVPR
jgi:hypothetical protein